MMTIFFMSLNGKPTRDHLCLFTSIWDYWGSICVCVKQLQPVFLTKQSGKHLKLKDDDNDDDDDDDNNDDDFLYVYKWQTHSRFFVLVAYIQD